MNMKKLIAGVMACCVVTGTVPLNTARITDNSLTTNAADYTEGTYEQLAYKKYSDHIEISGYNKELTEVVIPAEIEGLPVTSIGEWAFSHSCMKSIEIPGSVTSIGYNAFYRCENLTSVTILDGVKSIGNGAFGLCTSLTSITIPDSVTDIGSQAFSSCKSLKSIVIPDGVTSIGSYTFGNCIGLTSVTIPDSVTSIEEETFWYCSSLKSVTIPASVTNIGNFAFLGCTGLTSITILNPECEINDNKTTINATATIYGYENSTAQTYAEKYNMNFESLGKAPEAITTTTITTTTTTKSTTTTAKPTTTTAKPTTTTAKPTTTTAKPTTTTAKPTTTTAKPTTTTAKPTTTTAKPTTTTAKPITTTTKSTTTTTEVSVTASLYGDANCDGSVNIADATAIIQYLGNRDKYSLSEQGIENADCCNVGDGVTGLDAFAIQKLEAKLISNLPDTIK